MKPETLANHDPIVPKLKGTKVSVVSHAETLYLHCLFHPFPCVVIQINHLGHFLMCLELLPCMMSTEGDKRIILVSSMMHTYGVWDPNNLQGNISYGRVKFYGNSKLYNVSVVHSCVVIVNIVVFIVAYR